MVPAHRRDKDLCVGTMNIATVQLAKELLFNFDRAVQWNKDTALDWATRILLELEEPPRYLMKEVKPVRFWDGRRLYIRSVTPKTYFESETLTQIRALYSSENQK